MCMGFRADPRLYSKGRILGHKRGKRNSRPNQSLVAIEGVDTKEAARAYLGKVGLRSDLLEGEVGWRTTTGQSEGQGEAYITAEDRRSSRRQGGSPRSGLEGDVVDEDAQECCVHVWTHANQQRVAYVYKAKREINGSRVRVIWG
jgi:ribosomal protein L35AE/L33A